jgi:L-threonylcarbamoyladenylate synthase
MNEDIKNAIEVLRNGGIILYPTDTIWGLGCDPTNENAVDKLYHIKQRFKAHNFLILANSMNMVSSYVEEIPDIAYDLVEVSDKPITLIYPKAKSLAPNIIAEDGSIGIRIVNDSFCMKLIDQYRKPIVSTSANYSGKDFPENFERIEQNIKDSVDYIVNPIYDVNSKEYPSSIIKLSPNGEIKVLRD